MMLSQSRSKPAANMQTALQLRGVLPVVVDADIWEDAGEALDDIFIPDAEIWYVPPWFFGSWPG